MMYVRKFDGPVAKARWLWWRWVRRYRYEVCHSCGRPVSRCTPTWWHAPDSLWEEVAGGPGGVMCAACFTHECRSRGITVSWQPVVQYRDSWSGRWPTSVEQVLTQEPPRAGDVLVMPCTSAEVPAGWTYHEGQLWRIAQDGDRLPIGAWRLPVRIEGATFVP